MGKIRIPDYTLGEEITNSITHGLGAGFSLVALVLMIAKAAVKGETALTYVVLSVYGMSMLITYVISCVYHGLSPKLKGKAVMRVIDHCDIYLLVLSTISVVALLGIKGTPGLILFIITLFLNILGCVFTAIDVDKFSKAAVAIYLINGWSVLFFVKPLIENVNKTGILLIVLGGVSYSIGAILYGLGKTKRYAHSVFHVFVIAASVLQWLAIYLYLI